MNRLFLFICCASLGFSLWFIAAPAQAKWWQIFHHHKKDSTEQEQAQPPLSTPAMSTPYSSNITAPYAPVPGNRNTAAGTPADGTSAIQAVAPSLEPPPLPARPPIPDPPPVTCPAPLGSGLPKPTLAWRAKSIRQLSAASTIAAPTFLAVLPPPAGINRNLQTYNSTAQTLQTAQATEAAQATETAQTTDSGFCLTKTFAARFDDTFMAAVLALSKSGLSIRSMDSMHGKLESVLPDPRLRTLVSLQLNRDLLDATSVSCCCTAAGTASKMLIANVLSNISQYLHGSNPNTVMHASASQAGAPIPFRTTASSTLNAEQPR